MIPSHAQQLGKDLRFYSLSRSHRFCNTTLHVNSKTKAKLTAISRPAGESGGEAKTSSNTRVSLLILHCTHSIPWLATLSNRNWARPRLGTDRAGSVWLRPAASATRRESAREGGSRTFARCGWGRGGRRRRAPRAPAPSADAAPPPPVP